MILEVGGRAAVAVQARQPRNRTGIGLCAGGTYRLTASGTWTDLRTPCGADGYRSRKLLLRITERWRRMPAADWFALLGAVDHDDGGWFAIGADLETWSCPADGELVCCANDLRPMYFNNCGAVELTVERLA